MQLYEQAIRSARRNGFVHNEAVANELAGRFYLDRGLGKNADAHLHDARACYALWGADGKVRQLDRRYPHMAAPEGHRPAAAIGSPVQQLDVASVVKASQAMSSEIVLPKLIERLMTIALENAGADRGLLVLPGEGDHLIQAEARATAHGVEVVLCRDQITGTSCPEALLRYVIRTHQTIILDDASRPNLFSEDDYLRGRQPRSILCLPLIKQGRLTGLLYSRKYVDLSCIHPGSDRDPRPARGAGGDLAGEHPSLQRSQGTGGEGPTSCRFQHHRNLPLGC